MFKTTVITGHYSVLLYRLNQRAGEILSFLFAYYSQPGGNLLSDLCIAERCRGLLPGSRPEHHMKYQRNHFYKTTRWEQKRAFILRRDGYMCQESKRFGKIKEANTVHHIFPLELFPEYAWENWNLIALSTVEHNAMHTRNSSELTDKGIELLIRTARDVAIMTSFLKSGPADGVRASYGRGHKHFIYQHEQNDIMFQMWADTSIRGVQNTGIQE